MNQDDISSIIPSFVTRKRKQMIIEFIEYAQSENICTYDVLINLINQMGSNPGIIHFQSNTHRNYFQVGGSIIALAILRLFSKFRIVNFIGNLTEEGQNTFYILKQFFDRNRLILVQKTMNIIEIESTNIVISISDVECIPDWLYASFQTSEVYIKEDLLNYFPGYCFFSRRLYLPYESYLNFMIIETRLKELTGLSLLIDFEFSVKYDERIPFNKKVSKLSSSPCHLTLPNNSEDHINRISAYFLKKDPSKNKILIVTDFCKLLLGLLKSSIQKKNNELENCLYILFTLGIVSWVGYFAIHRTILCSVILTLFVEDTLMKKCISTGNLEIIIKNISAVTIPQSYRRKISESFKLLIEQKIEVVELLKKLDKPEDDFYYDEKSKKEELKEIQILIPSLVLVHPKCLEVIGKTLMGGLITLSPDAIPFEKPTAIKNASFLMVMRHELCHKKWYIKGSGQSFIHRTPPFKDYSYREAGCYLDSIVFGGITSEKDFCFENMTEVIAEKILNHLDLDPDEIDKIFIIPQNIHGIKSFRGKYNMRPFRQLCGGRIISTFSLDN